MFLPDYFPLNKFTNLQDQAQQFNRTVTRQWEDSQPRIINMGVALAGITLTTIAIAAYGINQVEQAYRWFMPRLRAAIDAFRDYRETPWYESWEASQMEPAIDPNNLGTDFDQAMKLALQLAPDNEDLQTVAVVTGVDNEPLGSVDQSEGRIEYPDYKGLLDKMDRCFDAMPDWIKAEPAAQPERPADPQPVEKRRPGRPKGSKNRTK